ncbi:hypothetical protein [Streptomyces lydicus]|uniref:hypothetical protein n=1 Tax=Streptomyces lydicus TaxID=47763 RepID=UPI0037B355C5
MDPAVAAALVATPSALLAAWAAYAAGRAQARSAQRGPIDAVRRQHQRDAYAELIRAAWSYAGSTGKVVHLVHQLHGSRVSNDPDVMFRMDRMMRNLSGRCLGRADLAAVFAPAELPQSVERTLEVLERFSLTWHQDISDAAERRHLDGLALAETVVALEGPDHLAELAEQLSRQAASVQRCWRQVAMVPFFRFGPIDSDRVDPEQEITPRDLHGRLKEAVQEFTRAARLHLNAH